MSIPNITTKHFWNARKVIEVCCDNDLYTCGDNESYNKMLNRVNACSPTTKNLYLIALDIRNIAEIRSQYSWLVERIRNAILDENEEQYQIALNLATKTVRKYIDYKAAIMRGLY